MNKTKGIMGYGKLGSTLAEALADSGNLLWIVDRNEKARKDADKQCQNIPVLKSINDISEVPKYIFITVNDSAIEDTAKELSEHLKEKLKGIFVIHCSGALTPSILDSCKTYGAKTASVHPYQTFYYPSKALLDGIGWSIQTDDDPDELIELVKMLAGNPEVLPNNEGITFLYHCSAVVASNFMNTLLSLSEDIAELAGIDAERFIPPIVKTTVENNILVTKHQFENSKADGSKEFPLTGPFARGDIEIIKKHIEALKDHPHLLKSYCYLGLATIEKGKEYDLLDGNVINEMEILLKSNLRSLNN